MVKTEKGLYWIIYAGIFIFLIGVILATPPTWQGTTINYNTTEDGIYLHNLSLNITGFNNDVTFAINTLQTNITWINASGTFNVTSSQISSWISIFNSASGNLTINATRDNQTGFFAIPIEAKNTTDDTATTDILEFVINATNDVPNLTNINSTYNMSQSSPLSSYLNASDEESQYPLTFNVSFLTNCSLANWSTRGAGNCTIFNVSSATDTSVLMNFTPTNNDVGVYWANISVMDAGANYACPHAYCDNGTYKQNKTKYYSSIVVFNVFSSLAINTSNCTDKIFQENELGWCLINITSKGSEDSLNISTYAILRNYASGQSSVSNTSWFYSNNTTTSSNFTKTVNVSVTPQKTEIGNWTINFTVVDITHNENLTSQIYVYVNRTTNALPNLDTISNKNTSVNLETVVNLTVYDNDSFIPDKNSSFGGFNETINFSRTILNRSNLSQTLTLSNFSITILQSPVSGTNRTTAEIRFTANTSDIGDYTINVSINDSSGASDYELFNLSIINNSAPSWFSNLSTNFTLIEGTNFYLNLSQNSSDPDSDRLTFSFTNATAFPSFSVNSSTGVINLTPIDEDVGQNLVNITISDGYLTATANFNFTVLNTNDYFSILNLTASNATPTSGITNGSTINMTEDNITSLFLWIDDDDFKIPSDQKNYYNESLTVNVSIQGPNTTLFNFTRDSSWPTTNFKNRTKYEAIFTPGKASVGSYNVTINVTDVSNYFDSFSIKLNISSVNHNPNLSTLSNQTSGENRSFYYDINVTDVEDGNDTYSVNSNFTFNYTFLSGTDFINNNQTIFNRTTGIFNITFNSSQAGAYKINISVNDTSGAIDYETFWIYVYGTPNISFPSESYVFNLTENSTSVLNFTVNHSVGDNLTYLFYVDGISYVGTYSYTDLILRYNTSSYGNGSNISWSFTPNLTDETYGQLKNLTLIVYSSSSDLVNSSLINSSVNFKLNISHANSPVNFTTSISDKGPVSYDNDITSDLHSNFVDTDSSDNFYNQTLTWTVSSNTSAVTSSVSSAWVLRLSSSSAVTALVNVTASDGSSNATSNSFIVVFTAPSSGTSTTSSSGGSTRTIPVSLKIIMPDPISAYQEDKISLPITLYNNGKEALNSITLSSAIAKNGTIPQGISMSFDTSSISSLAVGEKRNVTLTINTSTKEVGLFEITVNAKVANPKYEDWGKLFLTIKEGVDIEERILFTEEFIVSNPECIELKELVNEAKKYEQAGDTVKALDKAEEAIDACKIAISQANKGKAKTIVENKLYRYLLIGTLAAFLLGIGYYSYKRIKLRRRNYFIQQDIKNRNYFNNRNKNG